MSDPVVVGRMVRFGDFEINLTSQELRKGGVRIRLEIQPFQVLALLLSQPGEVVTREAIQQAVWPADTFVDFDDAVNTAISKIRRALGDSPTHPRFVETLPKRGYRFIGPCNGVHAPGFHPTKSTPGAEVDESANAPRFIETIPKVGYRFVGSAAAPAAEAEAPPKSDLPGRREWLWRAGSAGVAALAASAWFTRKSAPDAPRTARKFSFPAEGLGDAKISPDGRCIVYTARAEGGGVSLWQRPLDNETARELPGTQDIDRVDLGGWSPDSRSILFGAGGRLKRVAIDAGEPAVLCPLPVLKGNPLRGAAYSLDGERIVFSSGLHLYEIPARGGDAEPFFEKERGSLYWGPQFLPQDGGGRYLMYAVFSAGQFQTELFDSGTGERRMIAPGREGVYDPTSGFVIHGQGVANAPGLFAMPFSPVTLSATGESFKISDRGYSASVSRDGTLVFTAQSGEATGKIVVRDRSGPIVKSLDDHPIHGWSVPQISPDGTRVALRADSAVWVYDLNRGSRHRLSSGPNLNRPSWTSSGDEVVFVDQQVGFMIQAADGSAGAAVWLDSPSAFGPVSFSPDGRYAAYGDFDSKNEGGIWYREAGPDGSWSDPIPWLVTPASENEPQISPNGRYLAYRSQESGRSEVYVRSFPEGQEQWPVSTNGGQSGRWSADGGELFYRSGKALLSVPVSTADGFVPGVPRPLFEWPDGAPDSFAVFPDGERFLAIEVDQPPAFGVRIIENWYEEFRNREQ